VVTIIDAGIGRETCLSLSVICDPLHTACGLHFENFFRISARETFRTNSECLTFREAFRQTCRLPLLRSIDDLGTRIFPGKPPVTDSGTGWGFLWGANDTAVFFINRWERLIPDAIDR